ncbi:TonB-dependent receptor [Xylanibacter ruminicola]|uniref:Outer membrane receptor proteins, mostly Fe transport n=1 Tax=Xylanibacter ruminicola TaxID=839 RepID=A0A1M6WCN2_XYLRU|nr:TonB-dependent receptor [Xylanibacter ruminicola]SHK91409.1 Outer membrane receptor proteins, mostly Fe transport [Xylanibacter ruminicola]
MRKKVLFLALCPICTFAGELDEVSDTTVAKQFDVDEVTVVGFKQDALGREAQSVTSLSSAFIRQAEMTSIKDVGYTVPNFYIPEYGTRQNSPVFVRGVGAKTNGPTVGFYIDGVPHMERSAFDDDLFDITALEVLRGPQGTLYGRNCIGGIINAYTRSPFEFQGTRVKIGYGRYNDMVVNAYHYNKVNDKLGFAINGSYHHNDGYFRNAFDDSKIDKFNEGFLRGRVFFKPTERWTITADVSYRNSDQGGYPYATYDAETGKTGEINYNRYSSYFRQLTTAGLNVRYEGDKFSFNSQTAYQYIDDHMAIDQDFMPKDLYWVNQSVRQNIFSEELTLKSTTDSRYQWMVGAFLFSDSYNKSLYTTYIAQDYCTPKFYDSPTTGLSVYHQSSLQIVGGLKAQVGLRFDYEHAKEDYTAYRTAAWVTTLGNPVDIYNSKLNFTQFTPKFTLEYLTADNQFVYASVTRGYKTGGFNSTFQQDDERTFDPEYNWNYEVGAKTSWLNHALQAELTLFYVDWRHQQITQTIPGVGNITRNAGHSDSKGVELAMTVRPILPLTFRLSYGYTYARFLDYKRSETVDYTGMMLPLVPRHTLSLRGSYTVLPQNSTISKLVFSAGLSGMGKIYWNEDNAVNQPFYALLDAKVSATMGLVTWEVWGKNLTNTDYLTYYFKSSAGYGQQGRPVSFGTSLVFNF